MVLASSLY